MAVIKKEVSPVLISSKVARYDPWATDVIKTTDFWT